MTTKHLVAAFACLCLGASADSRSIMAVQIDLARQKETPSFVSNYMVRVQLEKPLSSGHLNFCDNLRRFDIALSRPMDLSKASGVSFELKCMDPSVVENVWLLFKSGAGYYRAAAEVPKAAGEWTKTTVAKADVRLYHWDAHMSLWEKFERPEEKDLPDWSRV